MPPNGRNLARYLIMLIALVAFNSVYPVKAGPIADEGTRHLYFPVVVNDIQPRAGWVSGVRVDLACKVPTNAYGKRPFSWWYTYTGWSGCSKSVANYVPMVRPPNNDRFYKFHDTDYDGHLMIGNEGNRPDQDGQTPRQFADFYHGIMIDYPNVSPVIGNIDQQGPQYLYLAEQELIRRHGETFASMTKDGRVIWGLHHYGDLSSLVMYITNWNRIYNQASHPIWITEYNVKDKNLTELLKVQKWLAGYEPVERYAYFFPYGIDKFLPLYKVIPVGPLRHVMPTEAGKELVSYP